MFELELYVKQDNIRFLGKHAGDLYIQVNCMLLTETYGILDAKMYADGTVINNWSTSGSGSINYNSDYSMSDGDIAYFKLSNLPSTYVIGLVDGSSYFQLQRASNSNIARIYVDGVSSVDYTHSFSANDIIKFERVSSTQQKVYINDVLIHTASNHSFNNPKPMIRKYNNDPYNMEYIYVL